MRTGHKLIHPVRKAEGEGRQAKRYLLTDEHPHRKPMLFALREDPGERNDLYREDSKEFKALKKALSEWQDLHKSSLSDADPPTKEMLDRLRMLGYLK